MFSVYLGDPDDVVIVWGRPLVTVPPPAPTKFPPLVPLWGIHNEPFAKVWQGVAGGGGGGTKTATLDAAIRYARAATATLDAVLQVQNAAAATLSAAVRSPYATVAVLDAFIQTAGGAAQVALDAAIRVARSAAATLDAAVRRVASGSLSMDVYIVGGEPPTFSGGRERVNGGVLAGRNGRISGAIL